MSRSSVVKLAAVAVVVMAAAAFLIGPRPDSSSATSPEVVAESGAETIEVIDPIHERPFEASTWAATGEDKHTLVIISHGFSGDRTSHDDLAVSLATAGFTVAAPTHPDLAGLESNDNQLDPLVLRPRHLSLTIDRMAAEAVNPFDSVMVVGHSLGGYSALRLAGANPSADDLERHCQANPTDEVLCTPVARGRVEQLVAGETDFTDSRVDAVVLLAPGYGPLFSDADLEAVRADALIVDAASDDQLPGGQVEALLRIMPTGTESVTVDGGHYVFLRPCTPTEASAVPELCTDEPSVDRTLVHAEIVADIESFLDR